MKLNDSQSRAMFTRAAKVMPRGVSSNFRYWGDEETLVAARAKGAYLWDLDDNRYIDYRLGFGPIILGHAHEQVDASVRSAIENGIAFAMTNPYEVRVAEKITKLCPGIEMLRFTSSGTEATMHALRTARAFTGREKVVKFEGHYHGMHDYLLWSTYVGPENLGARTDPIPVAASSGIPRSIRELIIMLPFNDRDLLERTLKQTWFDVAAIIVEPIMGNTASIEPQDEFLKFIRARCDEYGIVMIMDEVKTGFRVAKGGAQELFGVTADLATYAKALGNGYPVAAFGGRREIMDVIGKGVAHAGTYSGNVVGMAAADAVLDILSKTDALQVVAARGRALQKGIGDVLEAADLPYVITGHPSMFGLMFTDSTPRDYRDWVKSDQKLYESIMANMIRRGVMPDPDSREPWFLSAAHSEADVAETLNTFEQAVKEAKQAS